MRTLYGVGKFDSYKNERNTKCYKTWSNMIERCYSKKYQDNNKKFSNYTVCDEWLNYSSFKSWYNENYYEASGLSIEMNRSLCGGNIYNQNTILFLPRKLNRVLSNNNHKNNSGFTGVYFDEKRSKYKASISIENKRVHIGMFDTPQEASEAYKAERDLYISNMIRDLNGMIPDNIFKKLNKVI